MIKQKMREKINQSKQEKKTKLLEDLFPILHYIFIILYQTRRRRRRRRTITIIIKSEGRSV